MRFVFFLGTVIAVLILMQIYVAKSVAAWLMLLPFSESKRILIGRVLLVVLVYLNLAIPARVLIRILPEQYASLLKYLFVIPGSAWIISMMMMFFLFLFRDVGSWIIGLFQRDVDIGRRAFLQATGFVTLGAPLILTGYGALRTARDYKIRRVDIHSEKIPSSLDGLKIAHISDIHSGPYMSAEEMLKIRELMDSVQAEIAVLTGDFIDTRSIEIEPVAKIFSQLRTEYGVYACMGNHDLFDDYSSLSTTMRASGIKMLDNSSHILRINGDLLPILGIGDAGGRYNYANINKALKGVDPDCYKILLAHRPSFFPEAAEANIDLQLSGHTHGGQIAANFFGVELTMSRLFEKYVRGLYRMGKSQLYVNPGVGMVFAPVRVGVSPEITVLTLRKASV